MGTELRGEIGGLRTELHDGLGAVRAELRGEIGALRTDGRTDFNGLRSELAGLRTEVNGRFDQLHAERKTERRWAVTAAISVLALLVALLGVAVSGLVALLQA